MPHPTPYSRQFDAIRAVFARLFEWPGTGSRPRTCAGNEPPTDNRSGGDDDAANTPSDTTSAATGT
jgi:hypothetical protein